MTTLCLCTFELNHEITLEKNYQMLFLRAIWYGDNVELSHRVIGNKKLIGAWEHMHR
jgi:hypothetical protein